MRFLIPIGILVATVGGLAAVKLKQFKTISQGEGGGMLAEAVSTALARDDAWEQTVSAVGTVAAVRGVVVSAELAGVVRAIRFESGDRVHAGQVLVELDTSVERAQLQSAEARLGLADLAVRRTRKLAEGQAASLAQVDSDEAQFKTIDADVAALRAQIDRKTVRAPFAGRLGIRLVNLGQYLNPGTAVTVLESFGSVYVDFTVPQQFLGSVKVGLAVRVEVAGTTSALSGTIAAVDPTVDAMTRTIKLRASVVDPEEKLRPGMFVQVTVLRGEKNPVVIAPATAIMHASYGDSVFIIEAKPDAAGKPGKVARQQFVRVGSTQGDFVAISDGVKAGQELVTAGAFKLRNGSPVTINNDVKTNPALQPRLTNF